jgi:hemoglobin-like flavoprotein
MRWPPLVSCRPELKRHYADHNQQHRHQPHNLASHLHRPQEKTDQLLAKHPLIQLF